MSDLSQSFQSSTCLEHLVRKSSSFFTKSVHSENGLASTQETPKIQDDKFCVKDEITFSGIPKSLNNILAFLRKKLRKSTFFEDKLVKEYDCGVLLKDPNAKLSSFENMSIRKIEKVYGYSSLDAEKLNKLAAQFSHRKFFHNLNRNKMNNKSFIQIQRLFTECDNENNEIIDEKLDEQTEFAYLKYILLFSRNPILPNAVLNVFQKGVEMLAKQQKENVKMYVIENLENLINTGTKHNFEILREVSLFLIEISTNFTSVEEKCDCYLSYFNAMLQSNDFKAEYIPIVELMFQQIDSDFYFECSQQYKNERVVEKIDFVFCPRFGFSIDEFCESGDCTSGMVYITTHRVIFSPDTLPSKQEAVVIEYIGNIWIAQIQSVIEEEKNGYLFVRLISKDIRVVTFRTSLKQIGKFKNVIVQLQLKHPIPHAIFKIKQIIKETSNDNWNEITNGNRIIRESGGMKVFVDESELDSAFKEIQKIVPLINFQTKQNVGSFFTSNNKYCDALRGVFNFCNVTMKKLDDDLNVTLSGERSHVNFIFSVIKMMTNSYVRTIEGFCELLHREFFQEEFFVKKFDVLLNGFLNCVDLLLQQHFVNFEFTDTLIAFLFSALTENRYEELTGDYECPSLIYEIITKKKMYTNELYERTEKTLNVILPEEHFNLLFSKFLNYSKKVSDVFLSNTITTKNDGLSLYQFPPFPIQIKQFTSISNIDLSENRLREFPRALIFFSNLVNIKLQNNDIVFVTDQISQLTNLSALNLANNNLKFLPDFNHNPLKVLDLSGNDFNKKMELDVNNQLETFYARETTFYPTVLSTLPNLRVLDFSGSTFNISEIVENPPPSLCELYLKNQRIHTIPENITQLGITKLDLSNNYINRINFSLFAMKQLRCLDLTGNANIGVNAMFQTMTDLTIISENYSNTKRNLVKEELKKQKKLYYYDRVIVCGNPSKDEIFTFVQNKYTEANEVTSSGKDRFCVEIGNGADKRNVSFMKLEITDMTKEIWKYKRSYLVYCQDSEIINFYDFKILLILQGQLGCAFSFVVDSTAKSAQIEKDGSTERHIIVRKKKKLENTSIQKKVYELFVKKGECLDEDARTLFFELSLTKMRGFCITNDELYTIMDTIKIKDKQKAIKTLSRIGYLQTTEGKEISLVDDELFTRATKEIKKQSEKSPFLLVGVLSVIGVHKSDISFVIELMEKLDIIEVIKSESAKFNVKSVDFNKTYKEASSQFFGIINRNSVSITRTTSSSKTSGSIVSNYSIDEIVENKTLFMYGNTIQNKRVDGTKWSVRHLRNEIEIGECLEVEFSPDEMRRIMIEMMVHHKGYYWWESGCIVSVEDAGKIYVMLSFSPHTLEIRVRGLIVNESVLVRIWEMLFDITTDFKKRGKVTKEYVMCSECLSQGEVVKVSKEKIVSCVHSMKYRIKCEKGKHLLNIVQSDLMSIIAEMPTQFKVNGMNNYTDVKKLCEGSKSVISVKKEGAPTYRKVVMKRLVTWDGCELNEYISGVEEYIREIMVMKLQQNINVAAMYNYSIDPLFVTMEYFESGSLYDVYKKYPLTTKERVEIAKDSARGVLALHNSGLIHRDLKSPNILVELNNGKYVRCAISDFGQTVSVDGEEECDIHCPTWLAPEVLLGQKFTQKSDVYSFGLLLWELKNNDIPFKEFTFFTDVRNKVIEGYRPTLGENMLFFNAIITVCWDPVPQNRPEMKDVVFFLENTKV
ncbi:serine-threonine protein kinase, putative [Entamoeba invadens IP1]|uniref:serine-threonine protein kinase, putative n=1 Tax=Entamoeba invadens IP1 TaxID=370355 RepID=UPI0002C3D7CA|nr:serine-threonine protein kinase, putative [Entamoeba invadens IP1]ELP93230.1 serine-threonine protein kinase, putative [Entamoeba invadens IP1]|eukprot:XP_004260001.1 serine-threonine protein kinase, putative [Entamoeba invadens IP1]